MNSRRFVTLAVLAVAALVPRCPAEEIASLSNLSVRTTLAGGQTLIVGGVVRGGSKSILLRAGGPVLNQFGLSGMADPRISLYTTGTTPVASNDNWPASLASAFTAAGAFGFDPGSRDAALVQSLDGAFTVQATGTGPGTVLVEAYDLTGGLTARMINVSARNRVGTGADALVAGFFVSGTGSKTLLIRGVGPGLAAFGVQGTLADPLLQLFDSQSRVIATNDNWDASLAATFSAVGAFGLPANSRDAAMIVTLPAGNPYSVQVAGANNGIGEGIVEIYEIPDPLAEARLPNRVSAGGVHIGFPLMPQALRPTGNVRVKTIFVDFSDAPATRTPQSVFAMVSPGAENYWRGVSYGKMNMSQDAHLTWLRMSRRSDEYGWAGLTAVAHRTYIQEALNLAVAAGVDFSSFDTVNVMANPDATAINNGPTFIASGLTANNGKTFSVAITSGRDLLVFGYKWFNHEGGHMMGLPDLYGSAAPIHRHVGDYSLMGNVSGFAPEYLAWERWLLGWLDDDQVYCAKPGTTQFTLAPVETPGGKKMVVVPITATTAVVVENRRALGFDTALPRSGPLVYFIDSAIATQGGCVKVLPLDDTDVRKSNATMIAGQTITYTGVAVNFVSTDGTNVTVEVARP